MKNTKKENNTEQKPTYYQRNKFKCSNYTLENVERVIKKVRKIMQPLLISIIKNTHSKNMKDT